MFMFDEKNPVVLSWVSAVKLLGFKVDDIPNYCGLQDAVIKVLDGMETEE